MIFASSVSGISTYLNGSLDRFSIGASYVSGTPIVSSSTFNGQTLSSLGLPSSPTIGTWTLVGSGDTISVKVAPAPLPLLGAGAAYGCSRRLRRRIHLSRPRIAS